MREPVPCNIFVSTLVEERPAAMARIRGNEENPNLMGYVEFYSMQYGGVLVSAEVFGLPDMKRVGENNIAANANSSKFYGMHIHEFGDCTLPFDKTGNHYNPRGTTHPNHVGDMPPLLGNNGYAYMVFFDNRFSINEIIGKSIVIHSMRDDFNSQPSGDSGSKIGCGIISKAY